MKKFILFFSLFCINFLLFSQEALKSIEEEYFDYLSISGTVEKPFLNYRTLSDSKWDYTKTDLNIWENLNLGKIYKPNNSINLKFYGPVWFNSFNTNEPFGQNDGALWQGKGYNSSLTAGLRFEALGFEITYKPLLTFSQNLDFYTLRGSYQSEYSYYGLKCIDFVQRFGNQPYFQYDWGDSEIRYTWNNLTVGFGFQSPWLGPSQINAMLGSNNSGAYPKIDIGLRKTSVIFPKSNYYLGDFETRIWVGKLTESDYFDADINNNARLLTGFSFAYAPGFVEGLSFGLNRIFITQYEAYNLKYLGRLFTLSRANDVKGEGEDQKVSLNIDWVFPTVGFEFYAEYGFDDFTSEIIANPFHTGIYTLGLKKQFNFKKTDKLQAELCIELNDFEMSQDFQLQWQYIGFYGHSKINHGYTQRGQIIGAGYCPFGNSQYVGYKLFYKKGTSELYFLRYQPDANYIYNKAVDNVATNDNLKQYYAKAKTFFGFGIKSTYFVNESFALSGEFNLSDIVFHDFKAHDDYNENFWNPNFYFALGLKYNF